MLFPAIISASTEKNKNNHTPGHKNTIKQNKH